MSRSSSGKRSRAGQQQQALRPPILARRENTFFNECRSLRDAVREIDSEHRNCCSACGGTAYEYRAVLSEVSAPLLFPGVKERGYPL